MKRLLFAAILLFASLSFAAENYIQVPPDSTGKKTRTLNQTISSQDVHQSTVIIGNSTTADLAEVQTDGTLPVRIKSQATVIDTTTTPLGISATYTSPTFDTALNGNFLSQFIYADVDGTHKHDESHDGSTWREAYSEAYTAGSVMVEKHYHGARYVRYRFVNGGTAQATFNHQVIQRHIGQDEHQGIDPEYNAIKGEQDDNSAWVAGNYVGVLAGRVRASAPTLTDGNIAALRVKTDGDLAVTLDSEAVVLGAGTAGIGKLTANDAVDIGDVTVNNASGAAAVNIQDGGNSITIDNATLSVTGGGTEAGALRVTVASDSTGVMSVDDNGSSLTVDGTVAVTQTTASNLNAQVVGAVAHDAAVSGNPLLTSATAETPEDTAPANQVSADADVVRIAADRDGAIYTHPHPPRIWHSAAEYTTAQTDTSLKAAPGAGLSHYITDIYFAANGIVTITLEEGTTTLKFRYYAAAAGDGVAKTFAVPIKLTANTALTLTTSAATTCTVVINGYTAP